MIFLGSCSPVPRSGLISLYGVRPFRSCVVLAGNDDAYRAALDLAAAGVAVKAVVDLRSISSESDWHQAVQARGISLFSNMQFCRQYRVNKDSRRWSYVVSTREEMRVPLSRNALSARVWR